MAGSGLAELVVAYMVGLTFFVLYDFHREVRVLSDVGGYGCIGKPSRTVVTCGPDDDLCLGLSAENHKVLWLGDGGSTGRVVVNQNGPFQGHIVAQQDGASILGCGGLKRCIPFIFRKMVGFECLDLFWTLCHCGGQRTNEYALLCEGVAALKAPVDEGEAMGVKPGQNFWSRDGLVISAMEVQFLQAACAGVLPALVACRWVCDSGQSSFCCGLPFWSHREMTGLSNGLHDPLHHRFSWGQGRFGHAFPACGPTIQS